MKNLAKWKISPSEKSHQLRHKNLPMGKGLDIMKLKIPNISWMIFEMLLHCAPHGTLWQPWTWRRTQSRTSQQTGPSRSSRLQSSSTRRSCWIEGPTLVATPCKKDSDAKRPYCKSVTSPETKSNKNRQSKQAQNKTFWWIKTYVLTVSCTSPSAPPGLQFPSSRQQSTSRHSPSATTRLPHRTVLAERFP